MVFRMSGGPIHIGISDESPAARIRPEARAFASRHSGGDMSSIFKMTNQEMDHFFCKVCNLYGSINNVYISLKAVKG